MNINHSKLGDRIWNMYFISDSKSTKAVKRETLELIFEKLQAHNDRDAMKVGLVYLVSHDQLSNAKNVSVPDIIFYLANYLNAFNEYPWGNLVWGETKKGLLKATTNVEVKIKKGSNCYHLNGFPMALQVFAYEILPELLLVFLIKSQSKLLLF